MLDGLAFFILFGISDDISVGFVWKYLWFYNFWIP